MTAHPKLDAKNQQSSDHLADALTSEFSRTGSSNANYVITRAVLRKPLFSAGQFPTKTSSVTVENPERIVLKLEMLLGNP